MSAPAHNLPPTDERVLQRARALQKANRVRLGIADVKREVADGRLSVKAALYDPRAETLTVIALLMAQHRWGRSKARRFCASITVPELKRVGTLTGRQRREIRAQLAEPLDVRRRRDFDEILTVLAAEGPLRCQDLATEIGRTSADTKGLLVSMRCRGMVVQSRDPGWPHRMIWSLPTEAAA